MSPLLITIVALCMHNALGLAAQSNVQVRMASNGLNYAGQVAMQVLARELPKMKIPDIQEGDITASNFSVTKFGPPTTHVDMQAPNNFVWTLKGASIGITTHVHACKTIIEKICGDVDAQMVAAKVDIQVTTILGRKPEDPKLPRILSATCKVNIGDLTIRTSGGALGWIIDLFRGIVELVVKPDIEKAINDEVVKILTTTVNDALGSIVVDKAIGANYDLNYEFVADPIVTAGHLEMDLKGQVTCPSNPSIVSPYPYTPLAQDIPQDTRMVYVLASDKILNDFLYIAHRLNQTKYLVTENTPQFGSYLKLHCTTGICLGKYVINVDQLYPNVEAAEMLVTTTIPPTVRINADGTANFDANITSNLYAPVSYANSSIMLTTFRVKGKISAEFNASKLVGSVNMDDIEMDLVESQMDPRIIEAMEYYLNPMLKPLMEQKINDILGGGVTIPSFQGVTLENPVLRLLERTVQVEGDVSYNPATA